MLQGKNEFYDFEKDFKLEISFRKVFKILINSWN